MHEGQKSNGFRRNWSMHIGLRHHQPVPNQYRGGGPWVKSRKKCGLAMGRWGSLFWGSCSNSFREKCPVGMISHPKEVNMSWNQ